MCNDLRSGWQDNMNHLLRCMLLDLQDCHVVPFVPLSHSSHQESSSGTFVPMAYIEAQKIFYEISIKWDDWFGCHIWHAFIGQHMLWFGNNAVQQFLAMLLSTDEASSQALCICHARRGLHGVTTSWGPAVELDNHKALVLLSKILASVSSHTDKLQALNEYI
jgi:hypothetical protein